MEPPPSRAKRTITKPHRFTGGASDEDIDMYGKSAKRVVGGEGKQEKTKKKKGQPAIQHPEIEGEDDVFEVDDVLAVSGEKALVSFKKWDAEENRWVHFSDMTEAVRLGRWTGP